MGKKKETGSNSAVFPGSFGRDVLECHCDRTKGHKGLHRSLVTKYVGIKDDKYVEKDALIYWDQE